MRFGLVHRVMTDALAVLGLLALVTSGQLDPWMTAIVLLGLVGAIFLPSRFRREGYMRWMGVVAPLVLFGTQLARLALGGEAIPIIIEFAAGLQVIRLATRSGAAHDHQVIILALLHLIAGTVLGGGLAYALSFIGFLVLTPGALVLSHLRREVEGNYRQGARDRTGLPVDVPRILRSRRVIGRPFLVFTCLLSVPVFLFTAALFVAFPRVGFSLLMVQHSQPMRVVGFSERVDLGGVGTLRTDPTLVMRVELDQQEDEPPPRMNLYLRGASFDRYDGRSWSRTARNVAPVRALGESVALERYPNPERDRRMSIDLEPIDPPVVFLPDGAIALKVDSSETELRRERPRLLLGQHGELRYANGKKRGLRYDVFLKSPRERVTRLMAEDDLERHLVVPPDLAPEIRKLASRITQSADTPVAAARAIESHLREHYRYDLSSPSGAAEDPLADFLFVSKRGHCEFYSTAMAIMLRALGIPSRNVTGFVGGTYNRFGDFYAVRQGDAHSWVEAYLPRRGWTRFDPTPPANAAPQNETGGALAFVRDLVEAASQRWNRHVIGYNLDTQLSFFRSLRDQFAGGDARGEPGRVRAAWKEPEILIGIAILCALLGWRASRRLRRARRGEGKQDLEPSPDVRRSVELYQRVEQALSARGVPRPPSTPPLLHAQILREAGHPTADEALALTQLYLRARFGGVPLSADEEADFVKRAQHLRTDRSSGTDLAASA